MLKTTIKVGVSHEQLECNNSTLTFIERDVFRVIKREEKIFQNLSEKETFSIVDESTSITIVDVVDTSIGVVDFKDTVERGQSGLSSLLILDIPCCAIRVKVGFQYLGSQDVVRTTEKSGCKSMKW